MKLYSIFIIYFLLISSMTSSFAKAQAAIELSREAFEKGDFQKVINVLDDNLSSMKGRELELALLLTGESKYALKDMAGSAASYRRLLETFPGSEYIDQANHGLGWTLANRGAELEGANYLSRVVSGPLALESQIAAGRFYLQQKSYDKARKAFLASKTLDKSSEYKTYISYSLGEIEFASEEYLIAAGHFSDAAESDDSLALQSYIAAGRSALAGGDRSNAAGFLQKASALDPDNSEVTSLSAELADSTDDIQPIMDAYNKLDSPPAETTIALARLLVLKGRDNKALKLLQSSAPNSTETGEQWLYYKILAAYNLKKFQMVENSAREYLNKYGTSSSSNEIKSILTETLANLGRISEAAEIISADGNSSGYQNSKIQLAAVLLSAGKTSEAAATVKDIPKNSPEWGDARYISGEIQMKAGRNSRAASLYREAITASASKYSDHARLRLARIYILQSNNHRADVLLGQIFSNKSSPVIPEAHFTLGELQKLKGKYRNAIDSFMEYRKMRPGGDLSFNALMQAAWCYYSLKDNDKSLATYGLALSEGSGTDKAKAIYWIGKIHFDNGEYTKASGMFKKLSQSFPNFEDLDYALYKLGRCYERLDRDREAKSAYENLRRRFPASRWSDEARHRLRLFR